MSRKRKKPNPVAMIKKLIKKISGLLGIGCKEFDEAIPIFRERFLSREWYIMVAPVDVARRANFLVAGLEARYFQGEKAAGMACMITPDIDMGLLNRPTGATSRFHVPSLVFYFLKKTHLPQAALVGELIAQRVFPPSTTFDADHDFFLWESNAISQSNMEKLLQSMADQSVSIGPDPGTTN